MIYFFQSGNNKIVAVQAKSALQNENIEKLQWAFSNASLIKEQSVSGAFIGPRKEMITPWSSNAVEIAANIGIDNIFRIEEFVKDDGSIHFDPMLQARYNKLDQDIFTLDIKPEAVKYIEDIAAYNKAEGLALSEDEVGYLTGLSKKLNRLLTDSEIFGFSQVNSEHCRHKIFNGTFIIDGEEKTDSLFQLIKLTTKTNPNRVISAYKDNCAFVDGPRIEQFAPATHDKADEFQIKDIDSVISLKAETHNFPTTVEPFNGAATGSGGEIRDRMAGGKGSLPIAGTAVYMTSYTRTSEEHTWENATEARPWLYQTPEEILIKASNGASDFGNKFGQPLICGSVLTFEHFENDKKYGFDKVIMMAGGIGFANKEHAIKDEPQVGNKLVLLGGDNYRIGMGGGAVSSVATGEFSNRIELNAVQRSNPEMQKRAYNAIRALAESSENPIVSIHDHGAGGHLNCLSELVDPVGGKIFIDKLPIGDPTLSAKEIVGNESQERMGLLINEKDIDLLQKIADRERAPMYVVGEATGDGKFTFENRNNGDTPIDLQLEDMFGNPPKTYMKDNSLNTTYNEISYNEENLKNYIEQVLQIESVACKDYLTNKVDRSVTGRIAKQQNAGELHLPLNNLAVTALDYQGKRGIATSLGHAPVAGMVSAANGSVLSIAETLTNIIWTPIEQGLKGISLSANWMWPCKNAGEDARLYEAVKAVSDFSLALGINVPTGKDSLSMTQKYKDGSVVYAPGTVIISAVAESKDIRNIVEPVIKPIQGSELLYVDMSSDALQLGGSAFSQIVNKLGTTTPTVKDAAYFSKVFAGIQELIAAKQIVAGHDISSGGLITALLEMNFANTKGGLSVDLNRFNETDTTKVLFAENPAILIQVARPEEVKAFLNNKGIKFISLAKLSNDRTLNISHNSKLLSYNIDDMRDKWFRTSYLLDRKQCGEKLAAERFANYKHNALSYQFPQSFTGIAKNEGVELSRRTKSGVKAAIIREKGVNGDREMAWSLYMAGFDVKDVHMTDLVNGRETLEDVNMIVFVGGFSNSDVLGSAKGWAGAFIYNPKAKEALDKFYARKDTLSLGVCNGCQLVIELGLITPNDEKKPQMLHNDSHKFESNFINVKIQNTPSIMLQGMEGSQLGIWIAHGEGKFQLPYEESRYNIALKYTKDSYPANPNGSDYNTAGICSEDGRHLAMMPHLERAMYPWQWANYPADRINDEVSPWAQAFVNARKWIESK
ncbi:MAG: phosphoribosylformylglycinamidine synthase [Bacteroidota bacterium]